MPTHKIVSMRRGETSNSKSPMWRCSTADGERVNVFQHYDPAKNSAGLFEIAGYLDDMLILTVEQEMTWHEHPIEVDLEKKGLWWNVVSVAARPEGVKPDLLFVPDHQLYRQFVQRQAQLIVGHEDVYYFDLETTGLSKDDDILSIAVVNHLGEVMLDTLVKPLHMDRVLTNWVVHGLAPDMFADAPPFEEVYKTLCTLLTGCVWMVYNKDFDVVLLEQNCVRRGLPPIPALGVHCVMEMFAAYNGDWNTALQRYTFVGLQDAGNYFGLDMWNAHNALGDAQATRLVVQAMAAVIDDVLPVSGGGV